MSEAEALDNHLSLLLGTVSEMVGIDRDEHRRRWKWIQAAYPRTADAIHALLQAELSFYIAAQRSGVSK